MSTKPDGHALAAKAPRWWERGTIYQIYPRSFQDSDGDGMGDLRGIERRLDYLVDLGIDAVWLSPIFPSPMADFGYDVADYRDIDPLFGTLADFDRLIGRLHRRGLRLLLDFVPNHSSDRHPWFIESRSSRTSPKRDWYIWRDPAPGGGPPNNWTSDFGGSSWEYDAASGQYYLHAFLKEQPDLNWRNPDLRAAMIDVLRFWLDRGVDGFRIDVLWHMVKAADLPDNPSNPGYLPEMGEKYRVLQTHSTDQPEVHEIAAEFRALADSYGNRVLIGEIFLPVDRLMDYYGREAPEVHLPFNFQLLDAPWDARSLARIIAAYEAALPAGAWPASFASDLPQGGPSWPLASAGGMIELQPATSWTLSAGVFAGKPAGSDSADPQRHDDHGFGAFNLAGKPFLIAEADCKIGDAVSVKLGGWLHFNRFALLGNEMRSASPNGSIYGIIDWRVAGAANAKRRLSVFLRASLSPDDRNPVPVYVDFGTVLSSPFRSRPGDGQAMERSGRSR